MSSTALTQRRSAIPTRRSRNTDTLSIADLTPSSPPGHTVRGHNRAGQALTTFRELRGAEVSGGFFVNTSGQVNLYNERVPSRRLPVETNGNIHPTDEYSPNITPRPSQNAEYDIYYKQLLVKGRGTPLWEPGPQMMLPTEYRRNGISIGDVGILYRTGDFAFLFNIFLPGDHEINEGRVPNGFIPLNKSKVEKAIKKCVVYDRGSCLASSSLRRTDSSDFAFQTTGSEGAVLVMPDGALSEDLRSYKLVEKYIADNAKSWYEYVEGDDCGMQTENGDIRVVVGMDKASSWGMATFENVHVEDPLQFEFKDDGRSSQAPTYKWDRIVAGRAGPPEEEIRDLLQGTNTSPLRNQSVFVRTLNVSVAGKVRDELAVYEVRASCFRDSISDSSRHQPPSGQRNVNLQTSQIGLPVSHPSKLLNKYLLEKCPNAKIVITKDSDWISVITENDTTTPSFDDMRARVLASHIICENEGVVTLKKRENILCTGSTFDPSAIIIPVHQQTTSEHALPMGNEKEAYIIGHLFLETPDDRSLTESPGSLNNTLMEKHRCHEWPQLGDSESLLDPRASCFDNRNPSSRGDSEKDVYDTQKRIIYREGTSVFDNRPDISELQRKRWSRHITNPPKQIEPFPQLLIQYQLRPLLNYNIQTYPRPDSRLERLKGLLGLSLSLGECPLDKKEDATVGCNDSGNPTDILSQNLSALVECCKTIPFPIPDQSEQLEKRSSSADIDSAAHFDPTESTWLGIIQTGEEWVNIDGGNPLPSTLIWLHGAGAGKSALALLLPEKFQEKKQLAAGFFFRSDATRNNGGHLISTLLPLRAPSNGPNCNPHFDRSCYLPPDVALNFRSHQRVLDDSSGTAITGNSSVEYSTTVLVKELLSYISASKKFGCHLNLSRPLNTRSRDTYKAINQLIATKQNFENTFRDFDTSSKAIPVLERTLFDCYFAKVRRHTPDSDNVLAGITFIETADRKMPAQALEGGLHVQELQEGHFAIAEDEAALEGIAKVYQQYEERAKDRDIHDRRNAKPATEVKNMICDEFDTYESQDDVMIAVMGRTGAGKSSVINLIVGDTSVNIGDSLEFLAPRSRATALSSSFRNLPDPLNYLEDAKVLLSPHKSKLRLFLRDVDRLTQHLRSNDTRCAHSLIHSIVNSLSFAPRLLYGLNSIIRPHYRLECLTSISQVHHYVLVEGNSSWIYSVEKPDPRLPSSVVHVRNLIDSKDGWNRMLEAKPDSEWLACLAQVVQEILDDPTTNVSSLPAARKCLIRLSQLGVIPPSIFVHFPASVQPSDYAGKAEYITSGGGCDVYKSNNGDSSICFRVLRQPETSHVENFKFWADFCKEAVLWRQLKHPNILDFIGVTEEIYPRRHCFVLPWLCHGTIMNYLPEHPHHDRFASVGQIIDAVYYLHNLNPPVSHKDIKGANVLVRNDLVCVLTDFGLSNILDSRDSDDRGSLYWMAPEIFRSDPLGADARPRDIYSLGCTIYEIYNGKPPFATMHTVVSGNNPTLPPESQSWTEEEIEMWGYVGMCLDANPEARPDIKLLRSALWDIRDWTTSSFSAEPETVTPADLDRVQDWLKQEVDLISKLDIRYEVAQAEPLQQVPAMLRARGLHILNTPNYRWPPHLESLEANLPISPTLTRTSLSRLSAATELSSARAPSILPPLLTPRPVTTAMRSRLNRSSLRRGPQDHAEFTTTLSRMQLERIQAVRRLGSVTQEQPEKATSVSSLQYSYGRNNLLSRAYCTI